jgi:DNA invertase Pin-like site-specific DNA recombinase
MIKTAKPLAYSYVRFSAKIQRLGDSERRQIDLCRSWCGERNFQLDESLGVDVGVSSFRGRNSTKGVLGKFLSLVGDNLIKPGSFLLIENIDRFSRQDPWDAFKLVQKIIDAGISIVTIQDRQEYSRETISKNQGQIYILWGAMQRAHNESQTKSDRITEKWQNVQRLSRDKDFKALGNLPKFKGGRMPGWIKWTGSGYVLDKERAAVVRRIVKMAMSGMGGAKIAATLNHSGVPTLSRRGKPWEYSRQTSTRRMGRQGSQRDLRRFIRQLTCDCPAIAPNVRQAGRRQGHLGLSLHEQNVKVVGSSATAPLLPT